MFSIVPLDETWSHGKTKGIMEFLIKVQKQNIHGLKRFLEELLEVLLDI